MGHHADGMPLRLARGRRQCQHQPDTTTVYTRGGLPARVKDEHAYPLEAVCMNCQQPIRCESFITDWQEKYREPVRQPDGSVSGP